MAQTIPNKRKIIGRIHKLIGQLQGLERGIEKDEDFFKLLQQVGSVKGGAYGIFREMIEAHLDEYFLGATNEKERQKEAQAITNLLKSYLKTSLN